MRFKVFLEKILVPDSLNITTLDIDQLNNWYEDANIEFEYVEDPKETSHAYYNTHDGSITVVINPKKDNPRSIDTLISHEIIHKMQDIMSSKQMGKINIKMLKEIDDLKARIKTETNPKIKKELEKKLKKKEWKQEFGTPEEMMTYAYMLVRDRKEHNIKSPEDVVKFMKNWKSANITQKSLVKNLRNYAKQYWLIRDKL